MLSPFRAHLPIGIRVVLLVSVTIVAFSARVCANERDHHQKNQVQTNRLDRILVKPKSGVDVNTLAAFHTSKGAKVKKQYPAMGNLQVVELKKGSDVKKVLSEYRKSGLFEYAEPDHKVKALE
jgi:hypothetical protein